MRYSLLLLLIVTAPFGKAISQNALTDNESKTIPNQLNNERNRKGTFFIAPFYQYAKYSNFKLISHTNHFIGEEGETTYEYSDQELAEYNEGFETEYLNSMTALQVGYQLLDGLGVAAHVGASHFNFKSWASSESEQNQSTQSPALTLGLALDYEKTVYKKLAIVASLSTHYIATKTAVVDNSSGEDLVSNSFKAFNWQVDLGLAYPIGKFTPYAGAGFTQQSVNSVQKEQILTTDINGDDFYNTMEFDAKYLESSFYGFAGIQYQVRKHLSLYGSSTFSNPLRVNIGLEINL